MIAKHFPHLFPSRSPPSSSSHASRPPTPPPKSFSHLAGSYHPTQNPANEILLLYDHLITLVTVISHFGLSILQFPAISPSFICHLVFPCSIPLHPSLWHFTSLHSDCGISYSAGISAWLLNLQNGKIFTHTRAGYPSHIQFIWRWKGLIFRGFFYMKNKKCTCISMQERCSMLQRVSILQQ